MSAPAARASRWRPPATRSRTSAETRQGRSGREHTGCRRRLARRLARRTHRCTRARTGTPSSGAGERGVDLPRPAQPRRRVHDRRPDRPKGTNEVDLKVLVKPLVNLIWAAGFLFVFGALVAMWPDAVEQRRLAERYAAGAVRGYDADGLALVLAALLAVAVVVFVARPFLREPAPASDRLDELSELERRAARARRGARPGARGAEGARVRPSHGQGLRRRLPRAGRAAPPAGGRGVTCARTAGEARHERVADRGQRVP